jgi:hypothetical protein
MEVVMFGSDDDQEAARKKRLEEEQKKNEEDRQRKKEEKKEAEAKKAKDAEAWAELRKELDAATDPLSLGGAPVANEGSPGKKEAAPYQPPLIRPFGGPTVGPPRPVITSQNRSTIQAGNSSQSTKSSTASSTPTSFTGSSLKRPY